MDDISKLNLYIVRNSKGEFFRAKGFSGYGESWVKDINKAKIYGKIGPARSTVTYFSNDTRFPIPVILKLTISGFEIIDETERVEKVLLKKAKKKEEKRIKEKKRDIELAKEELARATENLKRLEKK